MTLDGRNRIDLPIRRVCPGCFRKPGEVETNMSWTKAWETTRDPRCQRGSLLCSLRRYLVQAASAFASRNRLGAHGMTDNIGYSHTRVQQLERDRLSAPASGTGRAVPYSQPFRPSHNVS